MGIAAPNGNGPENLTNGTLSGVSQILSEKVWRPVQSGGLSSTVDQTQKNLIKKATAAPATSTVVNPSGKNGVPKVLLALTATESPSKQIDRTYSEVSVAFTRDGSDPNFGSVRVWFHGYQGNATDTLMVEGAESPITFLCESTHEIVVVKAQTVSPSGVSADLSFALSTTVSLDGVVSAPPSPNVSQQLTATPTGYQFTFDYEAGLLADVISSYNIYRNTTNSSGTANIVKTVPQPSTNLGSYVYQETVASGTNYYYWVTAINKAGLESGFTNAQSGLVSNNSQLNPDGSSNVQSWGKNILTNPGFELKSTGNAYNANVTGGLVCNGWSIRSISAGFWVAQCEQASQAYTGSNNLLLRFPPSTTLPSDNTYREIRVVSPAITVYGAQQLQLNGIRSWATNIGALPAGVTGIQRINISFYQVNGTLISEVGPPDLTASASYANSGYYTVAVPSNASYCQVELCGFIKNNSGSPFNSGGGNLYMDLRFDDIELVLLSNIDNDVFDGFSYQRSVLGATLTPDLPYNGDFAQFANGQTVADGWTQSFEIASADATYQRSGTAYSGNYSQSITNAAGSSTGGSAASRPFSVKAGVTYTLSCYANSSLANPGSMYLRVCWYSQDDDLSRGSTHLISTNDVVSAGGPTSSGVWQRFTGTVLAPSNALFARIAVYNWVHGTQSQILFDRVSMVPTTYDLDNTVADGVSYGRVVQTALSNNQVDPSKAGVVSKGSTPFSYTGGFSFTTTTSSITISWTGLSILRSDGTTHNISNGSQTITGLSHPVTYYFYPYFDENLSSLSFVGSGTGSPAYAQTTANSTSVSVQNQQGKIPLSVGGMAVATPASGTGGGSGGGGGGGGCFTGNVAVRTPNGLVRFDALPKDEDFYIENLTGIHRAKLIVHENYSDSFISIDDEKLVTVGHGMKFKDKWISAREYFGGVTLHRENITVYNLHVFTECEEDRHYILETGDVAHNAAKVV
jgi:hypothetical protein